LEKGVEQFTGRGVTVAKNVSEPATRADLEGVETNLETKIQATRADLEKVETNLEAKIGSTQAEVLRVETSLRADIHRFETSLDAKIEAVRVDLETKPDKAWVEQRLEAWGRALMQLISEIRGEIATSRQEHTREIRAGMEAMRSWMKLEGESSEAARAAVAANQEQLRSDFEAHRDDATVHRAPRRRRS
jgi:hypothetical protein